MKSVLLVALGSGCVLPMPPTADSAADPRGIGADVTAPDDADATEPDVTGEPTAFELALFWQVFDPWHPYHPLSAAYEGTLPSKFSLVLDDPPPAEATYQIEDPELGVVVDESAPWVGCAHVYLTAPGALEENWEGVEAFDVGLVLGMSRDATVFYTPVDLETTAGIRSISGLIDDQPISAGYHLYLGPDEVDLDTPLEAEVGYIAS